MVRRGVVAVERESLNGDAGRAFISAKAKKLGAVSVYGSP